jgi:hypothetical protein
MRYAMRSIWQKDQGAKISGERKIIEDPGSFVTPDHAEA